MTHRVALVIDGEVVDMVVAEPRHAAILTSNPTIVDVTSLPEDKRPYVGWKYDGKTFTAPSERI